MECNPKCTEMLQVNQPIKSAAWGDKEERGWVDFSTVKPNGKYSTTCTRDVSNKMHMMSVLVRFPAMQMLLIPSETCRSDPWCEIKEWRWCFFRCHVLAAFQFLFLSAPYRPGCLSSTLWWSDSHTPRSPEPPGKKKEKMITRLTTAASAKHRGFQLFSSGSELQPTCWISLKSWLTSIIPPSNSLTASANASMVSISRWLVGSSRNNMWGFCQASQAKHTRHFWPSDRFLIGLT